MRGHMLFVMMEI